MAHKAGIFCLITFLISQRYYFVKLFLLIFPNFF